MEKRVEERAEERVEEGVEEEEDLFSCDTDEEGLIQQVEASASLTSYLILLRLASSPRRQ